MNQFKQYRRTQIAEMRAITDADIRAFMVDNNLHSIKDTEFRVSISGSDLAAGSPKIGDMIARNPKNHKDQWLVAKKYFQDNFEPLEDEGTFLDRVHKEKKDLREKVQKLSAFLSSAQSEKLTGRQRDLLSAQVKHMQNYHDILILRLDDLNNS